MDAPDRGRESIFRREAFEQHARGRIAGELVRVSPRWLDVAFWSVLALFAVGITFTTIVTLPQIARGPAAVDQQGGVITLIPARYARDIRHGMSLTFATNGSSTRLTVESVTDATSSLSRVPATLRDSRQLVGPVVAVTAATMAAPLEPGTTGRVEIALGSERLLFVLVPGLAEVFGR